MVVDKEIEMDKTGKLNIPCTYCEKDALPDSDPPVCEEHAKMVKKASKDEARTLKELETKDGHDRRRN